MVSRIKTITPPFCSPCSVTQGQAKEETVSDHRGRVFVASAAPVLTPCSHTGGEARGQGAVAQAADTVHSCRRVRVLHVACRIFCNQCYYKLRAAKFDMWQQVFTRARLRSCAHSCVPAHACARACFGAPMHHIPLQYHRWELRPFMPARGRHRQRVADLHP